MSLPEVLLWRILKQRPLGVKFRRQHPIGAFVADFYCDAANLVVEIDGIAHDMGDRPLRDESRDAWLRACGKQVIRIPAADVLANVDGVADSIVTFCLDRPPPSALRAATSPERGGFSGVAR
jgi:very-short-patch-repair endonuclease